MYRMSSPAEPHQQRHSKARQRPRSSWKRPRRKRLRWNRYLYKRILMAATTMMRPAVKGFPTNCATEGAGERDLPAGFLEFFLPLHKRFAVRHRQLVQARRDALEESLRGNKPAHLFPSTMTRDNWRIEVPDWCRDQRNQMTGPADEAELVVKMLNSGAPGVMLDLEDSMVNEWDHQRLGVKNILQALRGTLTYQDAKRGGVVGIRPSKTVIWIRARGLHL